jgi:hypothetical protein
MNITQ